MKLSIQLCTRQASHAYLKPTNNLYKGDDLHPLSNVQWLSTLGNRWRWNGPFAGIRFLTRPVRFIERWDVREQLWYSRTRMCWWLTTTENFRAARCWTGWGLYRHIPVLVVDAGCNGCSRCAGRWWLMRCLLIGLQRALASKNCLDGRAMKFVIREGICQIGKFLVCQTLEETGVSHEIVIKPKAHTSCITLPRLANPMSSGSHMNLVAPKLIFTVPWHSPDTQLGHLRELKAGILGQRALK